MAIPFTIFLGLYLFVVLIVLLFGLSSLYHLLKFGVLSATSVTMTFALWAGTAVILFVSYVLIAKFDWGQTFDVVEFVVQLKPF